MEYLDYLIYPIAGSLAFLAFGGLNTKHPVVVVASMISLALNGYAIIELVWWPIAVSIASGFLIKAAFGDPGAVPVTEQGSDANALDLYLLGGFPLIMGSLRNPIVRICAQIFILGMVDMKRSAEGLSIEEFIAEYDSLLARHDLSLHVPTEVFVQAIGQAASENKEIENLMRDGATSIKSYIVDSDADAPSDLGRAIIYAEKHERVFSPLLDIS